MPKPPQIQIVPIPGQSPLLLPPAGSPGSQTGTASKASLPQVLSLPSTEAVTWLECQGMYVPRRYFVSLSSSRGDEGQRKRRGNFTITKRGNLNTHSSIGPALLQNCRIFKSFSSTRFLVTHDLNLSALGMVRTFCLTPESRCPLTRTLSTLHHCPVSSLPSFSQLRCHSPQL